MRVASVCVVSESPEREAWNYLRRWAEPRGLLRDLTKHPVFGFNNPPPRATRRDYGYECWIRVPAATPNDGDVVLKDFEGGLFLVASCRASETVAVWMRLWQAGRTGAYRWRGTQELEKPHDPFAPLADMRLDLYLPVRAVADEPAAPVRGARSHAAGRT